MITVYRCPSKYQIMLYGLTPKHVDRAMEPIEAEKMTAHFVFLNKKVKEKRESTYAIFFLDRDEALHHLSQAAEEFRRHYEQKLQVNELARNRLYSLITNVKEQA